MTPVEQSQSEALEKACRVVGGQSALAAKLGGKLKQGHVFYWLETGRIPAQHCPAIERETRRIADERGDQSLVVTCEELCDQADWAVLRPQAAAPAPAEQEG